MAMGPVYIEHANDPPETNIRRCSGEVHHSVPIDLLPAGATLVFCALCFPSPVGLRVALRSAETIELLNELSRRLPHGAGAPERNQKSHGNRIGEVQVHPAVGNAAGYYLGPICPDSHRHTSPVAALRCSG